MKKISLADPVLGDDEKRALAEVIDSGWLTMGDRVAKFEKAFARMHKLENGVAVNSCTAGLHLGLLALGVGPGDEVLVPSLTFAATVNAVLYTGATPVFVDIEDVSSPHISMPHAETLITTKTKVVLVMHYGGYLVDLVAWRDFADKKRMFLAEDAAHAPATGLVGQLSDFAAFSFFSNKNITTAEGGMVLSRNQDVLDRIRNMRSHGMTHNTLDRYRGHAFSYDVISLGFNYRMDELRAALGLVQIIKLANWNKKRKELTNFYRKEVGELIPKINIPFSLEHETCAHVMPVILPEGADRFRIMSYLRENGIQSSIHYPPVHKFSFYKKRFPNVTLSCTEEFAKRELSLPLHPGMRTEDVEYVVKFLRHAVVLDV